METEIKLRIDDLRAMRRALARLGFTITARRILEINFVFDTPGGALRREQKLVRLRQAGTHYTITFKGAPAPGRHKSRDEVESELTDPAAMRLILERLGYEAVFRYEKYRTEYARKGQDGVAMLDQTPIGDFLELEGSPRWIDRTARALGCSPEEYITESYGTLYVEYCKTQRRKPGNMVFDRHERSR